MLCVPPPPLEGAPENTLELALYRPNKWPETHRTVTVRFLDHADGATQFRIAALVSKHWNRASGLQFRFVQDGPADVRVGLLYGPSWSYVGTYCLGVPEPEPTMNLGFGPDADETTVRRVVLHEFGHAAGFLHEHESPNAQIPWDVPAVYAYYRERGWDEATVDGQVLGGVDEAVAEAGTYDPDSILHYSIPAELVLDRRERGGGTWLSAQDVAMAQAWYGPPPERGRMYFPIARG